MTLSPINRFNLMLRGYSIWSASIRRRNSGLEHLIASMQPRKYSKDYSRRSKDSESEQWIPEALDGHLQKYSGPVELDYEELGGLSDLRQQDCSWAWNILE